MASRLKVAPVRCGIGLDPSAQQVFFTDNATDTITRVGYDGATGKLDIKQLQSMGLGAA